MKLKISTGNIVIVLLLIIFIVVVVYLTFPQEEQETGHIFKCKTRAMLFRANVTDCMNITVTPSDITLTELIFSPRTEAVLILVNPNGSAGLALSAQEVYTGMKAVNIPVGIVYTEHWESQPAIPNITIDQAIYENPVIWLRENQSKTSIEVSGPKVIVYAQDQYDLDSAACKIAILLLKNYYDC